MLRAYLERRRVRRAFAKYLDPKVVESFLRDGPAPPSQKSARIEFILAFVAGDEPAQVSERIAVVVDVAVRHEALVDNLIGALAVLAFGTIPVSSPPAPGSRLSLVNDLHEKLPGYVKIVHGKADGYCGQFGGARHVSFTFLVPEFDRALGVLGRLQFGAVEEFKA
jgi:hypothetical protein